MVDIQIAERVRESEIRNVDVNQVPIADPVISPPQEIDNGVILICSYLCVLIGLMVTSIIYYAVKVLPCDRGGCENEERVAVIFMIVTVVYGIGGCMTFMCIVVCRDQNQNQN